MLRKAAELRVHDDAQVMEIIDGALLLAQRDLVPGDLREAVFVQACGLYAQKQLQVEQVNLSPGAAINGQIGG